MREQQESVSHAQSRKRRDMECCDSTVFSRGCNGIGLCRTALGEIKVKTKSKSLAK